MNRLMPLGITFLGQDRASLEVWVFYLTWIATFGHAWGWPGGAWIGQCRTIAGLAIAAMALNWLTTGDHILWTLSHRHLWAVAGMDMLLLVGAAVALVMAHSLQRRRSSVAEVGPASLP